MKKTILFALFSALIVASPCTVNGQSKAKYQIKGKAAVNDNALVRLVCERNGTPDTLATTTVKNGEFTLEGTVANPIIAQLFFNRLEGPVVYLEKGKYTYSYDAVVMKNNKEQELAGNLYAMRKEMLLMAIKLLNSLSDAALLQECIEEFQPFVNHWSGLIKANPDSPISAYFAYFGAKSEKAADKWKEYYDFLSDAGKATEYGVLLGEMIKAATVTTDAVSAEVKHTAPKRDNSDVKRTTPEYDHIENVVETIIAQYPDKVVFVDYWATWCAPCVAAMDTIKPLKPWMEENNIVKVYISAPSSNPDKWEDMIGDIGGNHYWATQEEWTAVCKKFGIPGIPTYQIYDKRGEMVFQRVGYPGNEKMKEEFEKVL